MIFRWILLPCIGVYGGLKNFMKGTQKVSVDGVSNEIIMDCADTDNRCAHWASVGECNNNPTYMHIGCKFSCGICGGSSSRSCDPKDPFCQAAKVEAKVTKDSNEEGKARNVKLGDCADRHPECKSFAKNGECTKTPGWMIVNCPNICKSCHLLDPKVRCDRNNLKMSTSPSYAPGTMNAMFSGLVERFSEKYVVNVLSTDPWVVTFDNFIADDEAEALISTQKTWERSTDSGIENEFGEVGRKLSSGRTSSNSWCNKGCEKHPKVSKLLSKIETVVNVGRENYESFQVLKYDLGQKYTVHHDYGADDMKKACGPRILTFFLYLSDVEEGGETSFPMLNISVKPKKGRALLWPSTLDRDPERIDIRTRHEAKPVIKGLKFAANSWIHLYNFEVPNLWGCTGSFDEL